MFTLKFIAEVAVVLLIAYGIWHEDKLVEFEDRIIKRWCGE